MSTVWYIKQQFEPVKRAWVPWDPKQNIYCLLDVLSKKNRRDQKTLKCSQLKSKVNSVLVWHPGDLAVP